VAEYGIEVDLKASFSQLHEGLHETTPLRCRIRIELGTKGAKFSSREVGEHVQPGDGHGSGVLT
jgi:hypothetical protein